MLRSSPASRCLRRAGLVTLLLAQACAPVDDDGSLGELDSALTASAVPMYECYSASSTDHFLTVSTSQRDLAISYGLVSLGAPFFVEGTQVAGTLPFMRFYNGTATEHFYTTDATEAAYVQKNGWSPEGIEGYVYTTQVGGTVPLYRLYRVIGSDFDHRYTTSYTNVQTWEQQGWSLDGVKGYVFSPPPEGQNLPLTVVDYMNTNTVHVTNAGSATQAATSHWYYNVGGCSLGGLVGDAQDELNGAGGYELLRTGNCTDALYFTAIDDFHLRLYDWKFPLVGALRGIAHYDQETDAGHDGKEIVFLDRFRRSTPCAVGELCPYTAGGFFPAKLYSVKLDRFDAGVTVNSTTVPDSESYPALKLDIADFDGVAGSEVALIGGQRLLVYKDSSAGVALFRSFDLSHGRTWVSMGDTNGSGGQEVIELDLSGIGLRIFDPTSGATRTYNVPVDYKVVGANLDGKPGIEICTMNGSGAWYMITDRLGTIVSNATACGTVAATNNSPTSVTSAQAAGQ
jgi:hypothetical protein